MDPPEIVVQQIEGLKAIDNQHEREKSHIQIENPTTPASIINPDSFQRTTEYERALEEMANIINNSDNTFKRSLVNVIWKQLTV